MRLIESLTEIVGLEQPPSHFVRSREAVGRAGGKKLMIKLAREIKDAGDETVLLEGSRKSDLMYYRLTLLWGLRTMPVIAASSWESKKVGLIGLRSGKTEVELESGQGLISLAISIARRKSFDPGEYKDLKDVSDMSLEEQLRLAMQFAGYGLDFRYGEGEKSLRQKPVKSKFSRRIF